MCCVETFGNFVVEIFRLAKVTSMPCAIKNSIQLTGAAHVLKVIVNAGTFMTFYKYWFQFQFEGINFVLVSIVDEKVSSMFSIFHQIFVDWMLGFKLNMSKIMR